MQNNDNDLDAGRALDRARHKQNLIKDFLELAREQAEAIKKENYEMVLNTINKKQNIIEQVNLLDLNPPAAGPDDQTLQLINQETGGIMAQAIAIDDQNIATLKNRQSQILEQLKRIKTSKMTHSAYRGKNIKMEGILLDKKK